MMVTVTEPFTISALACQQPLRESSSAVNVALVGVLSHFNIIIKHSLC